MRTSRLGSGGSSGVGRIMPGDRPTDLARLAIEGAARV